MANVYPNNRLVIDKEKKFSNRRKYLNAISLTESWNRTISFPPFCMREKGNKNRSSHMFPEPTIFLERVSRIPLLFKIVCNNVVRRCNNALKIASLRFVWRYDTRERKKRSRSAEIGYRRVGRVEDSLFRRVKRFVISSFADWIE